MKTAGAILDQLIVSMMDKDKNISFREAADKVQLKNLTLAEIYSDEIRYLNFSEKGSIGWKKHSAFVREKVKELAEQEAKEEGVSFAEAIDSVFVKNPGVGEVYHSLLR